MQSMKLTILFVSGVLTKLTNILPDTELMMWMGIAMMLDFVTGVVKSKILGKARTSDGFKKSITKFLQYGGAIVVSIILTNTADKNGFSEAAMFLGVFNKMLLMFIIYIEITSVFENLYACDKKSMIAKYFFKPVLNFLTFQIRNNPATKLGNDES